MPEAAFAPHPQNTSGSDPFRTVDHDPRRLRGAQSAYGFVALPTADITAKDTEEEFKLGTTFFDTTKQKIVVKTTMKAGSTAATWETVTSA